MSPIQVGQPVPDFSLETFDPVAGDFGEISLEKQKEEGRYQMGSDPTGRLAKTFGVYLDDAGLTLRGTYLISPDGTLLNAEVNFLNLGRNVDELLRMNYRAGAILMCPWIFFPSFRV